MPSDDATNRERDHDRDALLALLLAAYLLTRDDITALSEAIASGYLISMQAAYREAAATVGSAIGQRWTPSSEQERAVRQWAAGQAAGIVATYQNDLKAAITTVLDAWQEEQGSLTGVMQHAPQIVGAWAEKRAQWKAPQVSNYSCGSGGQAGTSAFVVDVEAGNVIDTDTGEAMEIGDVGIACLPETASNDVCATVAGQTFDAQEWRDLPVMPAHSNCPHEYVVVMV